MRPVNYPGPRDPDRVLQAIKNAWLKVMDDRRKKEGKIMGDATSYMAVPSKPAPLPVVVEIQGPGFSFRQEVSKEIALEAIQFVIEALQEAAKEATAP